MLDQVVTVVESHTPSRGAQRPEVEGMLVGRPFHGSGGISAASCVVALLLLLLLLVLLSLKFLGVVQAGSSLFQFYKIFGCLSFGDAKL